MLRLFSLSQHKAVVNIQFQMRDGKVLMAILDDICTASPPDRVEAVHRLLDAGCGTKQTSGSMKARYRSGIKLSKCPLRALQRTAVLSDPRVVVWREEMPTHPHGMKVLHTHLVSHAQFIRLHFTHCVRTGHGTLSKCGRTTIGSRSC